MLQTVVLALFVSSSCVLGDLVPPEWRKWEAEARALIAENATASKMPLLANGQFGTVVYSNQVYIVGMFNGAAPSKPPMDVQDSNPVDSPAFPGRTVAVNGEGVMDVLRLYYSAERKDHTTCATSDFSVCPSDGAGYVEVRVQGGCLPASTPGAVPLSFYYSPSVQDNVLAGPNFTVPAGYDRVRTSCYGFMNPQGIFDQPLELWYNPTIQDHMVTASDEMAEYARENGYQFLGLQAYVAGTLPQSVEMLDMLQATFWSVSNLSVSGKWVTVSERQYASWSRPELLVHDFNVTCSASSGVVDVPLSTTLGPAPFSAVNLTVQNISNTPFDQVLYFGEAQISETPETPPTAVAVLVDLAPNSITVTCPSTKSISLYSAYTSSLFSTAKPLSAHVKSVLAEARESTPAALFTEHAAAWENRWDNGRIEVAFTTDSGKQVAQAANASLYDILSSAREYNEHPYEIPPGSAGTDAYNSNRFWDGVIWMGEGIAALQLGVFHNFLTYRLNTLPGAEWKAAGTGYQGASYAWQSGLTGHELMDGEEGHFEIHITSDVAMAVRLEYLLRRNVSSLAKYFPILNGTAAFWASRVVPFGNGQVTINNVQGPDEYKAGVNGSAYTNVAAASTLAFAAEAAQLLNLSSPTTKNWETLAAKMFVPYDPSEGIHPEFLGWKDSFVAKQADTILIYSMLLETLQNGSVSADVAYYASRTDPNGPAMTWSEFSIACLLVQNQTGADFFFQKSFTDNVIPPFDVWTEVRGGGGAQHFVTGAGGFLGSFIRGYGGLRARPNSPGVEWTPAASPPPNTTSLTLHGVDIFDCSLQLTSSSKTMTATTLSECDVSFVADSTCYSLPFSISRTSGLFLPKKCN